MSYKEQLAEESVERMTSLDIQIREFREQGRVALTFEDIQARYGVGIGKARSIIRGIRAVCGGGKLGLTTKVLMSEMLYWESIVDKEYIARL